MRYVVTGAAGFIGSHLLRSLLDRGHDAVGWDAFTDHNDVALTERTPWASRLSASTSSRNAVPARPRGSMALGR
jgi:nucleoside-diphosphate-sugar epimerase